MNFNNNTPIFLQVVSAIKKQIITKEYTPGDKLPTIRTLAKELNINPNTVQKTYSELERQNIVYTKKGTGTFIVDDANRIEMLKEDMLFDTCAHFSNELLEMGYSENEILQSLEKYLAKEDKE